MTGSALYLCLDSAGMAALLPRAMALLPPGRRKKAEAYREVSDRANCAFGYLLVCAALKREVSFSPSFPDFCLRKSGRPFFENCPTEFSMSHCKAGILCALNQNGGDIGADIQHFRPVKRETVMRVCSPREVLQIETSLQPEKEFCRLWTLKEALAKQEGGLRLHSLSGTDFSGTGEQVFQSGRFSRFGKEFFCRTEAYFSFSVCADSLGEIHRHTLTAEEVISEFR